MPYEKRKVSSSRYFWAKKTNSNKGPGDAIAFVPKNEMNVREVFAIRANDLGYRIFESRAAFPDYILGQGRRRILAEAEFRTSDFLRHKHDFTRCDLIIAWEHDISYMPIPVLQLSSEEIIRPRRGRPPRKLPRPNEPE